MNNTCLFFGLLANQEILFSFVYIITNDSIGIYLLCVCQGLISDNLT
jgi:hypothetical protein